MTEEELKAMKEVEGLYKVSGGVLVAVIRGKCYALVADQELSDDGWPEGAHVEERVMSGTIQRLSDKQRMARHIDDVMYRYMPHELTVDRAKAWNIGPLAGCVCPVCTSLRARGGVDLEEI